MQTDELPSIEREHRPPLRRRELDHLDVRDGAVRLTAFQGGLNVVPESTKRFDHP
jgi:hypothetical protein